MLTPARQEEILKILETQGSVRVSKLKDIFSTSESTIRRDINELHKLGKLTKVFGGAIPLEKDVALPEMTVEEKKELNVQSKKDIAKYAASLISPNDLVFIDAGTTTQFMLEHITQLTATYVTNAILHAMTLSKLGFNVILIGGSLKNTTEAIVGSEAILNLEKYNFTKAFFGANAISSTYGYLTPDISEASTKRVAISQTQRNGRFCLADSTKFNLSGGISFLSIGQADIISDRDLHEISSKTTIITPYS